MFLMQKTGCGKQKTRERKQISKKLIKIKPRGIYFGNLLLPGAEYEWQIEGQLSHWLT